VPLRGYQQIATDAGMEALQGKKNGILVLPTGSGKSHVIADMAQRIDGRMIVLQPSKEILEQNYAKLRAAGEMGIGIYSASCNRKYTGRITFATIGSVIHRKDLFADCACIVVDECHLVNSKGGRYEDFITSLGVPTIGLTATPYRLRHYNHHATGEHVAESRILTRTRPRIFNRIAHITQVKELLDAGYLSPCRYQQDQDYHEPAVQTNSTGQGYDDQALAEYNKRLRLTEKIAEEVRQSTARHVLVFCQFRAESERVLSALHAANIDAAIVDGETPKAQRESVLSGFKLGRLKTVVNVGVLTVGFDFPALDCIVLGRPTKSVALYYQMIGRGVRPAPGKEHCRVVDLCDNTRRFGRIETFHLYDQTPGRGLWRLRSGAGPLTGVDIDTKTNVESVPLQPKIDEVADIEITFGKHEGQTCKDVPLGYLKWACEKFDTGKWRSIFQAEIERRRAVGVLTE